MPFPEPLAGERLPAGELARFGSETVLWTPTIDAATTDPTLGAGEAEGWYTQQGRLCIGGGVWVWGAGLATGSGAYSFVPPVPVLDQGLSRHTFGSANAVDISASASVPGVVVWVGGAGFRISWSNAADTSPTQPYTWAAGDTITWNFAYPADWP